MYSLSTLTILMFFLRRQTFTLVGTEAGPLEAAGKDVAGVVKSIDAKLAAVGVRAEKVKPKCKGCPSVSECALSHTNFSVLSSNSCVSPSAF